MDNHSKKPDEVNLADIQHLASTHNCGGKALEIVYLDWHITKEEDNKREWKHKRTGFSFWQFRSKSGKTWDTGVWNKNLKKIASGKGNDNYSVKRAKYMLRLQDSNTTINIAGIKDIGEVFFSFEEDLPHHINEAIVIVTTGVPTSFFINYHVRQWLSQLNPKHRPIYREKLLRLLCVINFVLKKEINLFMDELYLEYQSSFVASTSDFWWDPVRTKGIVCRVYCQLYGKLISSS